MGATAKMVQAFFQVRAVVLQPQHEGFKVPCL